MSRVSKGKIIFLISLLTMGLVSTAHSSFIKQSEATSTLTETIEPVCYVTNSTSTTYYTDIDKALVDMASNSTNDTLYVIPGGTNECTNLTMDGWYLNGGTRTRVNSTLTHTIKSGDTMILPYEAQKWDYRTGPLDPTDDSAAKLRNRFADDCDAMIAQNRKICLTISYNVTLNIEGTVYIGGILGNRSSGYQGLQGQTSGFYAEILMQTGSNGGNGAKINIASGGTLNCRGYIKETSITSDANSQPKLTLNSGSQMYIPFVIYDYQGASATGGIYCGNATIGILDIGSTLTFDGEASPFSLFDIPNIQILTSIYSGSTVTGLVSLHTDSRTLLDIYTFDESWNTDQFTLIGSSNALLTINSGYINVRYKPANLGYTEVIYYENNPTRTTVDFYGNCTFGAMVMTLNAQLAQVRVDTSGILFPFSYRWAFNIKSGATINVGHGIKFMNGSSLNIDEGGSLILNNGGQIIFYNQNWTDNKTTIPYIPDYRISTTSGTVASLSTLTTSSSLVVSTRTPTVTGVATFINNGTVQVRGGTAIGGLIETSSESGYLSIDAVASVNIQSLETNGTGRQDGLSYVFSPTNSKTLTESGRGYIDSTTSISTFETGNNYDSLGTYWHKKRGDITSVSINPMSYTTSRYSSGSVTLNCIVSPAENDSTIVGYQWTITNTFDGAYGSPSLPSTSSQSVTLSLPRRGIGESTRSCNITVTVTFIDSNGVTQTLTSEAGTYTSYAR